jgi:hypothetical protein
MERAEPFDHRDNLISLANQLTGGISVSKRDGVVFDGWYRMQEKLPLDGIQLSAEHGSQLTGKVDCNTEWSA